MATQEFVEVDGLVAAPDTAGTSKIRHSGLSADSGAGEENNVGTSSKSLGKFFQAHFSDMGNYFTVGLGGAICGG
jgi:hypothetical protein